CIKCRLSTTGKQLGLRGEKHFPIYFLSLRIFRMASINPPGNESLATKSLAPAWRLLTRYCSGGYELTIITGKVFLACLIFLNITKPLSPGIARSEMTRSHD